MFRLASVMFAAVELAPVCDPKVDRFNKGDGVMVRDGLDPCEPLRLLFNTLGLLLLWLPLLELVIVMWLVDIPEEDE